MFDGRRMSFLVVLTLTAFELDATRSGIGGE